MPFIWLLYWVEPDCQVLRPRSVQVFNLFVGNIGIIILICGSSLLFAGRMDDARFQNRDR